MVSVTVGGEEDVEGVVPRPGPLPNLGIPLNLLGFRKITVRLVTGTVFSEPWSVG